MTEVKDQIEEMIDRLKEERDELRVRLHLAKEDISDEWDKLEAALAKLESRAKHVGGGAKEASIDVAAAAKLLAEEIGNGFKKIRRRF